MSTPNSCPKCSNGETPRTTNKVICLFCHEMKPVNEMIEGMCKECRIKHGIEKWKTKKPKPKEEATQLPHDEPDLRKWKDAQ